jgi:hypothetical protein
MEVLKNRKSMSAMLKALQEGEVNLYGELLNYSDCDTKELNLFEVIREIYDEQFADEILDAQKLDYDLWDKYDDMFEMKRDKELEERQNVT